MIIELTTKSEDAAREFKGLRMFASNFCPEHKVACIIANPQDTPLDLVCALEALDSMKERLLEEVKQRGHKAHEN